MRSHPASILSQKGFGLFFLEREAGSSRPGGRGGMDMFIEHMFSITAPGIFNQCCFQTLFNHVNNPPGKVFAACLQQRECIRSMAVQVLYT